MSDSLLSTGDDVSFAYGQGMHSLHHGGSLFAETLRWMAAEGSGKL